MNNLAIVPLRAPYARAEGLARPQVYIEDRSVREDRVASERVKLTAKRTLFVTWLRHGCYGR